MAKTGKTDFVIEAKNLSLGYGDTVLLHRANFRVRRGDVFAIMGESGCGKSSLLRVMIGLNPAISGSIVVDGVDMVTASEKDKNLLMQRCGVLYQSGALFSAMTLFENIALPLQKYTDWSDAMIKDIVRLKLRLVGLDGYQDFYPSEISGGMRKRAGLARAIALDPEIVYFDEPSAGLDPVSSKELDDLILSINRGFGTTIVIVTHELSSIFSIADNGIFLSKEKQSIVAEGNPWDLLKNPPSEQVYQFLTRGENEKKSK